MYRYNPSKNSIIRTDSLSINDVMEYDLIPGFRYQSAPDLRWFESRPGYEHLVMPQFKNESWSEWSIVQLGPRAIEACHGLGMPVVMVSWSSPWHPIASTDPKRWSNVRLDLSGYDYEEKEAALRRIRDLAGDNIEPLPDNPDVYVLFVEEKTFVAFTMRRDDIFNLARYFVTASRIEHRNPALDYGTLPPGHGWGEVRRDLSQRSDSYWVAPLEELAERYREVIVEDRFIELKAPDSGSIKTGKVDPDRDMEWL